jgi:hypothetical protein
MWKAQNVVYGPDETEEENPQAELEMRLAVSVRRAFSAASDHRRSIGVDDILLRCAFAKKRQYTATELAGIDMANPVHMGIASLKSRAAASWLTDILMPSYDKPWALQSTPIPKLPSRLREAIIDALETSVTQRGTQPAEVVEEARLLKTEAMKLAKELADKANKNMERLIEDQLQEGNWTGAFGSFIDDLSVFPTAGLRGPVFVNTKRMSWDDSKMVTTAVPTPFVQRVSPFDMFPSPDSTTTQDGKYFITRSRILPERLFSHIGMFGFREEAIRKVLASYPDGFSEGLSSDSARSTVENKEETLLNNGALLDTLVYNGQIDGQTLIDAHLLVPDPQAYYEVEVWTIADTVVKAVLNPYSTGRRPIYTTSWVKLPGSFWGESVVSLLLDIDRVCNATARSIIKNAAYSAGPIGEVDVERLASGEDITHIEPYRMYGVTPDMTGGGRPAFNFLAVPNVSAQLQGLLEYYKQMADDVSGVPAYVLGSPAAAGAGRTATGLAALMSNAAKGVKAAILNIDRDVTSTLVTGYYEFNLMTSEDQSIKGDAQVFATGASGLLQRELSQSRNAELLSLLAPYTQTGVVKPETIQILLREILKSTGLPVDDMIPDPAAVKAQAQQDILSGNTTPESLDLMGGQLPPATAPSAPGSGRGQLNPSLAENAIRGGSGQPPIPDAGNQAFNDIQAAGNGTGEA